MTDILTPNLGKLASERLNRSQF